MKTSRRDVVLVVVAALAFASAAPFAKIGIAGGAPPIVLACTRTLPAAFILALVSHRELSASLRALTTRERGILVLAGALLAAHFVLFLAGLALTSLPAAVALVALEPISVVVWAFALFGIRPSRGAVIGLAVATIGAFVIASAAGGGEHRLVGDVLVFGCVILYGAYVAAARRLKDALPIFPFASCVFAVSTIVLAPFALREAMTAPAISLRAEVGIAGLAIFPTLVGHTLVQLGARRASPVVVALVSPGEALGSILIGALVVAAGLGDVLHMAVPTPTEALGAALILTGATVVVTAKG
jgi:drug/metabolite transporter (DMT)-like permease